MFTIFDKSGTGTVDPIDFQHVCHDLGVPISETEAIAVYGSHDVRCVCHVSVFVSDVRCVCVCVCTFRVSRVFLCECVHDTTRTRTHTNTRTMHRCLECRAIFFFHPAGKRRWGYELPRIFGGLHGRDCYRYGKSPREPHVVTKWEWWPREFSLITHFGWLRCSNFIRTHARTHARKHTRTHQLPSLSLARKNHQINMGEWAGGRGGSIWNIRGLRVFLTRLFVV